ncbi:DUF2442 domain-containing protein [Pseudomonas sp. NPDC007930]|uniref:DUF2442 domain-containing protein n=1 Tax=Pseudomonas sp. NPDC007930 TaxID=3364417 RepID=UPI0036E5E0DA
MAPMKRPRLASVRVSGKQSLQLQFIDGRSLHLHMGSDIAAFPGLRPLKDAKAFAQATLGDGGWSVEWPKLDIQLGADTLLYDALAQNAPDEETRVFIKWRATSGLPLKLAADALGVAQRTITRYSSGQVPVPKTLALACIGWETQQQRQVH